MVAEHGQHRDASDMAQLFHEDARFIGFSIIREISAQEQDVGLAAEIVKELPQLLGGGPGAVQISDRGDPKTAWLFDRFTLHHQFMAPCASCISETRRR